jgi:hypothetical protein
MREVVTVILALIAFMWLILMIVDELSYAGYMAVAFLRKTMKGLLTK